MPILRRSRRRRADVDDVRSDLPQGTLYPALHRLEQRGYLSASWKASDTGRDAKFYRLTKQGQAQLESGTASWERLAAAIGLILRPAGGRP